MAHFALSVLLLSPWNKTFEPAAPITQIHVRNDRCCSRKGKKVGSPAMRLGYFKLLMCSPACNARPRLKKKERNTVPRPAVKFSTHSLSRRHSPSGLSRGFFIRAEGKGCISAQKENRWKWVRCVPEYFQRQLPMHKKSSVNEHQECCISSAFLALVSPLTFNALSTRLIDRTRVWDNQVD